VPAGGDGYDLILVGKATDGSGFGGAAFASLTLDAAEAQSNKSAVQVPDPFLKNVIMRATYAVVDEAFSRGIEVGFKDLGAGGIMGSSSELCSAGGFGASIELSAVPQAVEGLPPYVIACAETQERMLWAVPPSFSPVLLSIYNERFTLPQVAANARAAVIGTVTKERRYRLLADGSAVCDLPIEVLTGAVSAERVVSSDGGVRPRPAGRRRRSAARPVDVADVLANVLAYPDVCSRRPLIEHYDVAVRGATVVPSGHCRARLAPEKFSDLVDERLNATLRNRLPVSAST